jgi:hypothetical protein
MNQDDRRRRCRGGSEQQDGQQLGARPVDMHHRDRDHRQKAKEGHAKPLQWIDVRVAQRDSQIAHAADLNSLLQHQGLNAGVQRRGHLVTGQEHQQGIQAVSSRRAALSERQHRPVSGDDQVCIVPHRLVDLRLTRIGKVFGERQNAS